MERKTFVIARSTWHRGRGTEGSMLLIPGTGKMCCLGSISLQAGATEDQILNELSPAALRQHGTLPLTMLPLVEDNDPREVSVRPYNRASNSVICGEMMLVNDDPGTEDAYREEKLTSIAATLGWDLTFVD